MCNGLEECLENGIIHKDLKPSNIGLIGRTNVIAVAEDDSKITKVEFYIDGELLSTDTESPYEYSFRKIGFFRNIIRRHTITVKAYDDDGKTSQASREVLAFYL